MDNTSSNDTGTTIPMVTESATPTSTNESTIITTNVTSITDSTITTMSTNKSESSSSSETLPTNAADNNNNSSGAGNGEKPLGLLARAAIMKRQMDMEDNEQQQQTSTSSDNSGNDDKTIKIEPANIVVKKAKKSSTANNEKISSSSTATSSSPTIQAVAIRNRQFTLKQVSKFSDKRLLSTFVEYKRDVKTKRCSYSCQLLPQQCQQRFESVFGSAEAEQSKKDIVDHLRQHLCNLEQTMPNLRLNSCRKIRKAPVDNKKTTTTKQIKQETENIYVTVSVAPTTTTATSQSLTVSTATTTKTVAAENDILKQSIANAEIEEEIYGLMNIENNQQRQLTQQQPTLIQTATPVHHILNTSLPISTFVVATPAMAGQTSLMPHHTIEDVSQTVEIISSTDHMDQHQNQSLSGTYSTAMTTAAATTTNTTSMMNAADPSMPANQLRALALDYIDDIRKKSSSAARSIIVNGDKSVIYQCKICPDKQFTSTNGLIFHYKKHAGLKPYVCDLCSATFTRQHSLNYHMLIHLNKSRFICSECSRHFRHPSHFKEHMRRHTGETPFQCSDCLIKFKTRNTYKRHLQTKHSKILTSKGIIEVTPGSQQQPSQQQQMSIVPTPTTATTTTKKILAIKGGSGNIMTAGLQTTPMIGQVVAIGPSTSTLPIITGTMATTSASNTTSTAKPRRKYGIKYLHKNIETMTKYEQQQHQTATLIPTNHLTASTAIHHPQNQTLATITDPATITGTIGAAATAQTAPGSNITILRMPQYPSVHILDNGGGTATANAALAATMAAAIPTGTPTTTTTTAIARKTTLLNRCHQQQPPLSSTQTSFSSLQPGQQQQTLTLFTVGSIGIDSEGKPIFQIAPPPNSSDHHLTASLVPTFTTNQQHEIIHDHHQQQSQQQSLTELTSAIPLTATSIGGHHQLIYHNQPHQILSIHPQTITPSVTSATVIPTTQSSTITATTNDNFMCLLEAIEMTKDEE
ncbi:hypothetical protein DERP_007178 [Dermatophagoides pteronyssinus]|uniref:C2H2-type domain-containing protein n=1 Tax=Dermatophagoides pteronyssinus TaxID=6956 RepID=A0ABQ8JUD6_DERPT|nr:hypothetical protein DERP_007178 [Dermatophagoides pteronyssinus]